MTQSISSEPPLTPGAVIEPPMSLKQPVWHVAVLSMTTFMLYGFYWYYKSWRDLLKDLGARYDAETANKIVAGFVPPWIASFDNLKAGVLTFFSIVPFVNVYLFFMLIYGIARLNPDKKSLEGTQPLLCSLLLTAIWAITPSLARAPGPFVFLFFVGIIPSAIAQHWMNQYWDSVEQPGLLTRHGFSFKELVVVIFGALALGFLASSFILGINK